jgi:hypothetical protein
MNSYTGAQSDGLAELTLMHKDVCCTGSPYILGLFCSLCAASAAFYWTS